MTAFPPAPPEPPDPSQEHLSYARPVTLMAVGLVFFPLSFLLLAATGSPWCLLGMLVAITLGVIGVVSLPSLKDGDWDVDAPPDFDC